jgi:SAM-dependent methyltransferase
VLDIGCGTGPQTLVLARRLNGKILAIDHKQPNLDALRRRAEAAGVSEKIETRLQDMRTLQFDEGFSGREALIRWTNELWFRLFHDTANPASTVAVGQHDVLIKKNSLEEYFLQRNSKVALEPWVKNLRRLQDFCRQIGMGFVVVLAPSKATIYPEDIPRPWRRWYDPGPRAHIVLTELFRENGVVFVDAVDLVAREKLKGPPAPLFPKGGIHWNRRAAFVTANAVQARLAEQNKPAEPIESAGSSVANNEPNSEESDLVELMNLTRRWKYPCEKIAIKPSPRPRAEQMTMAMVGDSFSWNLLRVFSDSGQFSETAFYFYYRQRKTLISGKRFDTVRAPALPLDFSREIFAADCLLLEINETAAVASDHYLSAFISDALAHLPDSTAPRPPFRAD